MIIIIPIWWRDKDRVPLTIETLKKYINPNRIILCGPIAMKETMPSELFEDGITEYMDGNLVVPGMSKEAISAIITKIQRDNGMKENPNRAGWLMQQFIKLGFAKYTDEERYLVWDGDIQLLGELELTQRIEASERSVQTDKPKFVLYDHHMHVEYLPTIERLFDEKFQPQGSYTFVNPYMLFDVSLVRQMLDTIEANNKLDGDSWWEKCISVIPLADLTHSGFSEFETYGEYVINKHPDAYVYEENYIHLLCTKRYFGENVPDEMLEWLSKDFKTIGFEGYDKPDEYWINRTRKAFNRGKNFRSVYDADVRRQKLKNYWHSGLRKLGITK